MRKLLKLLKSCWKSCWKSIIQCCCPCFCIFIPRSSSNSSILDKLIFLKTFKNFFKATPPECNDYGSDDYKSDDYGSEIEIQVTSSDDNTKKEETENQSKLENQVPKNITRENQIPEYKIEIINDKNVRVPESP